MIGFTRKLAQSRGLQQSTYTVIGNTFATMISALALILLSRILGPSQFGEFSVGFSLVLIMVAVNGLGLGPAITKYIPSLTDHNHISRIVSYTLRIKLVASLLIVVIGVLLTPWLTSLLHLDQPFIIYTAFLTTGLIAIYEHILAVLQSLHRFVQAVVVNLIQSSLKLLTISLLVVSGYTSALPAFILYMMAPLGAIIAAPWLLPSWFKLSLVGKFEKEKNLIINTAQHTAVGFVVVGIIDNVDVLFVRGYLNAYETGLLSGVSRIALFLMLMAYSLGNVLFARVARYKNREDLRKYLLKASGISLIALFGFLVFIPFGSLAIWLTIGQQYLPGLPILLILMAAAFLTLVLVPFQALFYSFEAPWYFSVTGIAQLVIVLVGNGVFVPIYGLEAAAWTRLISRIILCLFTILVGLFLFHKNYGLFTPRQKKA